MINFLYVAPRHKKLVNSTDSRNQLKSQGSEDMTASTEARYISDMEDEEVNDTTGEESEDTDEIGSELNGGDEEDS
jgi:hypothetical protein